MDNGDDRCVDDGVDDGDDRCVDEWMISRRCEEEFIQPKAVALDVDVLDILSPTQKCGMVWTMLMIAVWMISRQCD